jgi:hypothetical protein
MTGNRREQLRQMIREIVKEELDRSATAKTDKSEKKAKTKGPQEPSSCPQPVLGNRETAPPPPWALFGSPQPAPDGKEKTPFHHSRTHQLYTPDSPLNPPPFISGNRVSD